MIKIAYRVDGKLEFYTNREFPNVIEAKYFLLLQGIAEFEHIEFIRTYN